MKKLAVHLHLYYTEQLPQILKYLRNLTKIEHDLFVTIVNDDQNVITQLKAFNPQAKIWVVENRGYDIGPFIDFLHHINLADYEYILKLHTKGKKSKNHTWLNGHRMDNALWGKILWQSMLATPEEIEQNFQILDTNNKVNMLGSRYCITKAHKDYDKLLPQINEELSKMGLSKVSELSFIAGSTFLTRAKCLSPLLNYTLSDFALTDGNIKEGTLAHVLERVFGVLGKDIYPIAHGDYTLSFIWVALKRFLYQKKVTNNGKCIIKICKLPLYAKEGR